MKPRICTQLAEKLGARGLPSNIYYQQALSYPNTSPLKSQICRKCRKLRHHNTAILQPLHEAISMTALMALLGEKAVETKGPRPGFLGLAG